MERPANALSWRAGVEFLLDKDLRVGLDIAGNKFHCCQMEETILVMESLKNRFPFRLGTTSYIIPADLLTNVRWLASCVDDIELLLFEADDDSNLPDKGTIAELDKIARSNDLSYTVHVPLGLALGAASETERLLSVN
ncbi:MAG: hypothetical protein ACM337_05370, partial [Syntrophaceae bacterium]